VRHLDAIDDVLIANNIAHSANGEKVEGYDYWWSWQDTAREIQTKLSSQRSGDLFGFPSQLDSDGPFSLFGCGNFCG
jgi:phosphosulfolactate phosphohydrolase-like enzyme